MPPDRTDEVLLRHKHSNIDLTRANLACMRRGQWLNDEVMNVYACLLQERDARRREQRPAALKCHFFNSFFVNKLYRPAHSPLPVRPKHARARASRHVVWEENPGFECTVQHNRSWLLS